MNSTVTNVRIVADRLGNLWHVGHPRPVGAANDIAAGGIVDTIRLVHGAGGRVLYACVDAGEEHFEVLDIVWIKE